MIRRIRRARQAELYVRNRVRERLTGGSIRPEANPRDHDRLRRKITRPIHVLFTNARGQPLTRYGVRYLLKRYVQKASQLVPSLKGKSLHPHSIRHSTAVALLKSGVDFATISQWLGHAGLNTTMRYARADIDLKRRALAQAFPDAIAPPPGGRLLLDGTDLVSWMRRL